MQKYAAKESPFCNALQFPHVFMTSGIKGRESETLMVAIA